MKVGIVTFFQDQNVGTCLQAYALQEAIKEMGHDVELINYCHDVNINGKKKTNLFSHIKGLIKTYINKNIFLYFSFKKSDKLTFQAFEKFKKDRYLLSKKIDHSYNELSSIAENYDAFVCGSDMIWAPNLNIDYNVYYLQFCENKKRISYAPSFGTSFLDENYINMVKKWITEIPNLSCREQNGVDMIKKYFGINANIVLDPTQLLNKNQWINKFSLNRNNKKKYILCYLFPSNYEDWYNEVIHRASKMINADIRYIPMGRNQHYKELKFGVHGYGPEEFLNLVYGAEFVITNSYHGLMFSLIFEKPFCILRRDNNLFWSKYEDRFDSLLKTINYEKAILNYGEYVEDFHLNPDYEIINTKLNNKRQISMEYLNNALKRIENMK